MLAVVIAGLLLGHKAPLLQSASSRLAEQTNWRTIQFLLENAVFLLIGLQTHVIVEGVVNSPLGLPRAILVAVAVFLHRRPAASDLDRLVRRDPAADATAAERRGRVLAHTATVLSWAGMRGVVTLAAAFCCPRRRRSATC